MDTPLDPFAGDPDDPARQLAALDDEGEVREPLAPGEREQVLTDLEDLEVIEALLAPRGVQGLVVFCEDCRAPHCVEWPLVRDDLRQLLDAGTGRTHEPAWDPDPARFVTWDYARGFLDASLAG